jgi:hypothetical protein
MNRILILLLILGLPTTSADALTCGQLWAGWVFSTSNIPGRTSSDWFEGSSEQMGKRVATFVELREALQAEAILSKDEADEMVAYDAGFFHGYIHVFGLSSQHINFPVDSGHKEWGKVVGKYLDVHRKRLKEFAPLCVEDALIEVYGLR